jgi:hypothetical protein
MEEESQKLPCERPMPARIHVVDAVPTRLSYGDSYFEVSFDGNVVTIVGPSGQAALRQKNQQVAYKATLLGGLVLEQERQGEIDYESHFFIDWEEEYSVPELQFKRPPDRISRVYQAGQRIELGVEQVSLYCVRYSDGVEARFVRRAAEAFDFSFSTGFYGSFRHDEDGSYTLQFKGDRLEKGEDDLHSQSKFVVSRSKYSGMLLLILQDDATVMVA